MAAAPELLTEISTRHQVYIERLKSGEVKELRRFLEDMDRAVRARLAGEDITDFTRGRLESLVDAIRQDLSAINGEFRGAVMESARQLGLYESGFEVRSLNQIVQRNWVQPSPSQVVAAIQSNPLTIPDSRYGGMMLESFITDAMRPGMDRVTGTIRAGYYQGQTTNQILQAVRGTRAAGFTDGILQSVNREAESIVRTSLQHAATQARLAVYDANADIIKGVQWNATLESRTCPVCGALDGKVFPLDKGPRPPLHPNCRCATTAVLDERFAFLDKDATRHSRGPEGVGSVDATETFYGWLKGQPEEFVASAIGPSRAKLLLDGGLSVNAFAELQLGRQWQPLTLAQMQDMEPTAFKRAGLD